MGKDSGMMKLFASKGTRSPSPARETAAEMERRALSPILVKPRNKVPAHPQLGHSNIVHPTSQALKKNPSLVNQKNHSGEYVENVTTVSPGTPERSLSAPSTPKSASKKKFGWNVTRQPHEDSTHGSFALRSAMISGSPKHLRSRDGSMEFNNQFSDTSSSSSSTCSDLTIASSSLYSGYTVSSKMGYDSESAPSTPRSTPRSTPGKNIPRPGKPGVHNSSSLVQKGAQRVSLNSKGAHQTQPSFELHDDPEFWNDHNVQVLVRTRPVSSSEASGTGFSRCVKQDSAQTITWLGHPETRFTYDHVAGESITQEDLFKVAGTPMVENCMRGYNSSMFAYGQTGSGKTYTMLGDIDDLAYRPSQHRGMTPRIFEYLFSRVQQEEQLREHEQLRFVCKCSFLEIYNEHITDLLEPSSTNLQIREDAKSGVYVENLTEVEVKSVQDVVQLLIQGASNRKVAATNMNRESSRSHSVFACSVESKWESNSLTNIRFSRLNLVDLAGSERQKSSGAEGDRLKEAANINKSLSTLGLVIMILVDVANGKQRHVPYRDSKLTFLLQDSLGGNSKTTVIATISPSSVNAMETMSTLRFSQRAKFIRNNAHVNEDSSGDVLALRREIQQLKEEISQLKLHSVSDLPPLEGDQQSLAAIMPNPGYSSNNLLHKIRAVEAALSAALRREQQAQSTAKRYAAEIDQLQSLVQQRDQNSQSGKMILRFRDDKIRRLEAAVAGRLPIDDYLVEENKRLGEEIELVRAQIDRNPELTRFAMDNIRLQEQVRGFQEFHEQGERAMMVEEIANLRDQLLEMTETKLALEQGALTLSNSQADKYRKELEICCNDLSTCLEINSTLTKQVEKLKSDLAQLSARCQEQQQDLDFLKAQPMERFQELELERSIHLQIIEDLKAQLQLQQKESEDHKRSRSDDDVKSAVQDKHTVDQNEAQVEAKASIKSDSEPYAEGFTTEQDSLFDEDIEQLQVCDVKQAAMETEFETFAELMTEKESLLDEDLDKLDVRDSRRQSLESEFEAYSKVLEDRTSYITEEMVCQKVHARTLEMTAHFEPFTELMEGEETLLRESLEKLASDTKSELEANGDHLHVVPKPASDVPVSLDSLPEGDQLNTFLVQSDVVIGSSKIALEHDLLLEDDQLMELTATRKLSEGSELNLSGLDILQSPAPRRHPQWRREIV